MYINVYVYVCMYICVHVCKYVCKYVCIYVSMYTCMKIALYIYIYIYYMYIYICLCTCINKYIHTRTHKNNAIVGKKHITTATHSQTCNTSPISVNKYIYNYNYIIKK